MDDFMRFRVYAFMMPRYMRDVGMIRIDRAIPEHVMFWEAEERRWPTTFDNVAAELFAFLLQACDLGVLRIELDNPRHRVVFRRLLETMNYIASTVPPEARAPFYQYKTLISEKFHKCVS